MRRLARCGGRACAGLLLAALLQSVAATCRLPIDFPSGAELTGLTVGPDNSLVVSSSDGKVFFADLDDFGVREDEGLNHQYKDAFGWFDLEGVGMVSPESTYMYLGMANQATVLEYEWHESHKIFRKFTLEPSFQHSQRAGIQSITWVPTDASTHQGYFYIGSHMNGHVFIYEFPLLEDTGPEASAVLRDVWVPPESHANRNIGGLSYAGGYIFVNYDDENSNHVLIYPVMDTGMPGALLEQYEVDVKNAEGMAVRKTVNETFEVFFTSKQQRSVLVYTFHFETGFELHGRCAAIMEEAAANRSAGASLRPGAPLWALAALLLTLAAGHVAPAAARGGAG